jgi:hypothetical protein
LPEGAPPPHTHRLFRTVSFSLESRKIAAELYIF